MHQGFLRFFEFLLRFFLQILWTVTPVVLRQKRCQLMKKDIYSGIADGVL